MYGLLQLLPQSDAFRTLHARLHAAPTAALLQLSPPRDDKGGGNGAPGGKSPSEVDVHYPNRHLSHSGIMRQVLPAKCHCVTVYHTT